MEQHLSDVFKFVQGFGQKGHQIGRKIGDALELIVFGMINNCPGLADYMVVEDGIEGATSAKHKVEFAFFKKDALGSPTKRIDDLFGIVECKKVGVEVTTKHSFKQWQASPSVKGRPFYETGGHKYSQTIARGRTRDISVAPANNGTNLRILITERDREAGATANVYDSAHLTKEGDKYLLAIDVNQRFHVVPWGRTLMDIEASIDSCIIITVNEVDASNRIKKLQIDDCLAGPQTPEKAKQASFVSLDVRKRVLGQFDKTDANTRFTSILVIGEASHWEAKSRAMVRLCNDYNLIVPDEVIIKFFELMLRDFGDGYQDKITKNLYRRDASVKRVVDEIIEHFEGRVLREMDTGRFKKICFTAEPELRLRIEDV